MVNLESQTLTTLADSIKESAQSLQHLLTKHNLPQPSFSPSGRRDWSDTHSHPSILTTRSNLIDTVNLLLDLALGPHEILAAYAGPRAAEIDVVRTLNSLGVADAVPLHGEISISDLAQKTGVKNAAAFEKQLRFAYLMGMFRPTNDGKVAHTGLSAAMPDSSAWIGMRFGKIFDQGAYEVANALCADTHSDKVSVPCELADPTNRGRDLYAQLEDEPDGKGMERHGTAMKSLLSHYTGGSSLPLIYEFDWKSLGSEATVVDVGGGNGHIEVEMAPLVPEVSFVVQDLQSNEEGAKRLIEENGLTSRVHFQAHDFFLSQPALPDGRIPKAYLLIRVLQDWQDFDCARILKPFIPAMERYGTKLWIVARILPDGFDELPIHSEKLLRTMDLLTFTLGGNGERSFTHLRKVLETADTRLRIENVRRPLHSVFSVIEIILP